MSKTDSLFVETARKLGEARRILEVVEATALGGVGQTLAKSAESPAKIARHFMGILPEEGMMER